MAKRSVQDDSIYYMSTPKKERLHIISPSEIKSPDDHATVRALIVSMSPEKASKKFFDGELTDGETVIRMIGFENSQRQQMEAFHKKGAPVVIKKCQIKSNKFSHKVEVLIKQYSKIEVSGVHFNVPDIAIYPRKQ